MAKKQRGKKQTAADRARARRQSKPLVLVFGEGEAGRHGYDAEAIALLLPAMHESISSNFRVSHRKSPPSLTRAAGGPAVRDWMDKLSETLHGEQGVVAAVVVHQDTDGADPDGVARDELRSNINSVVPSTCKAIAACPEKSIEAWWIHFPEAVRAVRPGAWRDVRLEHGGETGGIDDPKALLMRKTRVGSAGEYKEAMSPDIASNIVRQEFRSHGLSRSWERFKKDVLEALCA